MRSNIFLGVLFLVAALLQSLSVYLMAKGHQHYLMRILPPKAAMVIYCIFATTLYFVSFKMLTR